MGCLAKGDLLNEVYKIGEAKSKYTLQKFLILGMFAGLFVGTGGFIYVLVSAGMKEFNPIIVKLIAGICFTFGIFAVLVSGADLFTGNILVFAPFLAKKVTLQKLLKNWAFIFTFNFLGAILVALTAYYSGLVSPEMAKYLHKIVDAKVNTAFFSLVLKGIGCNFLVCVGVWMGYASTDVVSKYFASAIPVVVFLVLGFEHSVANMFYFALSFILNDVSVVGIVQNLIPVTIGNILGGMIVAGGYYFSYRDK